MERKSRALLTGKQLDSLRRKLTLRLQGASKETELVPRELLYIKNHRMLESEGTWRPSGPVPSLFRCRNSSLLEKVSNLTRVTERPWPKLWN